AAGVGSIIVFYKQKTAYEMIWRLEFRRVLFRSPRVAQGAGRGGVVLGRHIGIMLSRKGASKTRAPHLTQAYLTDGNVSVLAFSRSEERRVGKECRSRVAT